MFPSLTPSSNRGLLSETGNARPHSPPEAMTYFMPLTDFLPATVFLRPLRVRAFVWVR